MSTYLIQPGRQLHGQAQPADASAAELEIRDDGGLRIYVSSLSRAREDGPQLFFEVKAIGLAHRLVALVAAAADESAYFGNWTLAFGATGLRGSHSFLRSEHWDDGSGYTEDRYSESVIASYADLIKQPRTVVDRLVGGVIRGFGTRQFFLSALTDPVE